MMKLTYHQATYDLLTQKPIETQRAIKHYDDVYHSFIRGVDSETRRQDYEKQRNDALAWTKLNLYQYPAQFSEKNIQQLDTLEAQYQVKLPAAVREWHSLDIVPEIMSAPGGEFGFMPISDFKPFSEMRTLLSLPELRPDLWYFMFYEFIDQGGEYIAFKVDAGDDPPVFAEYGEEVIELAPSFSEFIYFHFWDWYGHYMFPYNFSIVDLPMPIAKIPLRYHIAPDRFRQRFSELKSKRQIRFYDDHTRIWPRGMTILTEDRRVTVDDSMVAGGRFQTNSLAALEELIRWLWGDDAPVFRMNVDFEDESKALLERLQFDLLRRVLRREKDWVKASDLAQQLGAAIPMLSTPMMEKLKALIQAGEVEGHPENRRDTQNENRFRVKAAKR